MRIPRIQPSFSNETIALIRKLAREAGMSASGYVRDAACRSAGWDEAMSQLRGSVDALRAEVAELRDEVERLKSR